MAHPLPKIVGGTPTTTAKLAGMEVECLIDTGSMVTLVLDSIHQMQIWRNTRSAPGASSMKVRLVRPRCFVLIMLSLKSLASWTF